MGGCKAADASTAGGPDVPPLQRFADRRNGASGRPRPPQKSVLSSSLIRPLRGHLPPKGKVFGRLIAAPTKYGKLSGLSVGADDLGGPRAHPVRPYSGERGGRLDLANSGAVIELR